MSLVPSPYLICLVEGPSPALPRGSDRQWWAPSEALSPVRGRSKEIIHRAGCGGDGRSADVKSAVTRRPCPCKSCPRLILAGLIALLIGGVRRAAILKVHPGRLAAVPTLGKSLVVPWLFAGIAKRTRIGTPPSPGRGRDNLQLGLPCGLAFRPQPCRRTDGRETRTTNGSWLGATFFRLPIGLVTLVLR